MALRSVWQGLSSASRTEPLKGEVGKACGCVSSLSGHSNGPHLESAWPPVSVCLYGCVGVLVRVCVCVSIFFLSV